MNPAHQRVLDKVLRYGRDLGSSDTVRNGKGTRCRVRRWAHYTVRMDLFVADYAPVRAECLILKDKIPVARYVSTDLSVQGLQMLYYDGILIRSENML